MTFKTLTDLDAEFVARPGVRLVEKLPLQPGGVDPLGLRQINLSLMNRALPGINNVTSLIRPYTLMAWAWWTAAHVAEATGRKEFSAADLLNCVERLETVFVWSHMLAHDNAGLPGRNILARGLPKEGDSKPFTFAGARWDKLRQERRANTSFMAAVQYGPSIRTAEGLGWLAPVGDGSLVPAKAVLSAVKAFDAVISTHLPNALRSLKGGPITAAEAAALHKYWTAESPTSAEQAIFRAIFFDRGLETSAESPAARRRATLRLVFAALKAVPKPLDLKTIRRIISCGHLQNGTPLKITDDLLIARKLLTALQARQLQRVALESLIVWIEEQIDEDGGVIDADRLADKAHAAAQKVEPMSDASDVKTYIEATKQRAGKIGWPAAAGLSGDTDIFDLMDRIETAQEEDRDSLPGLLLTAIGYVAAIFSTSSEAVEDHGTSSLFSGPHDRLPINLMSSRIKILSGSSLRAFWKEIIESWVLGQHVRWSVARNGDGTQRLRLALDEGGWVRLRSKISGPFRPTSDRLATALALSADCGLLKRTDDDEPLFLLNNA